MVLMNIFVVCGVCIFVIVRLVFWLGMLMLFILNLVIIRCCLFGLFVVWLLVGFVSVLIDSLLVGFSCWGSGEFWCFGFLVYEVILWVVGEDLVCLLLVLKLIYKCNIVGKDIVEVSVKEICNFGIVDEF